MRAQAKYYGEYPVLGYQAILGVCALVTSGALIAATMGFPNRQAGTLQVLYLCGLFSMVALYRFIPLLTVFYGALPLLYPLLGRWVALPFFFRGISVSLFGSKWLFALTAILGYIFHRIDQHDIRRIAKEDQLCSDLNAEIGKIAKQKDLN